ncbi:MAG: DUF4384 domain-containing protein [Magnetococcus sp. DMHC-1]|nr:DUF4384 domain-containing protein [Magnetococcales bacterium]
MKKNAMPKKFLPGKLGQAAILTGLAGFVITGCVVSNPETASVVSQPKTAATKNITSFSAALSCMDDLFLSYKRKGLVITSQGLPDETQQVKAGTKDMMISAISAMSVKSNAFKFVDFDGGQTDISNLQNMIGSAEVLQNEGFQIPSHYIRGAITSLDPGVTTDKVGGGISVPALALGVSKDQMVSVISMDMNIGNLATRQILPGKNAKNSISVVRAGAGGDADGKIGKAGLFFNLSLDRSEGPAAAVRTLIELSLIEVLGKLNEVPYWKCLDIPATSPQMMQQAREWYDRMSIKDRTALTQRVLQGGGYLTGDFKSGVIDEATKTAISRFQSDNGQIADGRINFDLYYSFLTKDLILAPAQGSDGTPESAVSQVKPVTTTPLSLKLSTSKGKSPTLRAKEQLQLDASVTDPAYLYCFYQDHTKTVVRVFPNRFKTDSYIGAGERVKFPDKDFSILMEKPNTTEKVLCMASRREVGISLPHKLYAKDLAPLKVGSLDEVLNEFKKIDGLLAHDEVTVKVTP